MRPFFFFNDTATTEIYTLSLHDALPISGMEWFRAFERDGKELAELAKTPLTMPMLVLSGEKAGGEFLIDRKSTRLNSSHSQISYAVFCLKKKKKRRRDSLSLRGGLLAHH